MSKKYYKAPKHTCGKNVTTKTWFGSDSEMIVNTNNIKISLKDNEVLCKDDDGFYITEKSRINNGLADPNRYADSQKRLTAIDTQGT